MTFGVENKINGFTDPDKDFSKSMGEWNELCYLPMNSLTSEAKRQHPIAVKLRERYEGFTLSEFLNHTGKEENPDL